MGKALDAIAGRDVRDFFEHCGYQPQSGLLELTPCR
jgi:hypothetical protein